jgi:MoaA/NifB/PqqE/SkfB family radical SAM enzyme
MSRVDFNQAPMLLFWETTRACRLACKHCRAEAINAPMPGQLSTEEGLRLIEDLRGFAPQSPVLIFTGGDPFMRADLCDLAEHAGSCGLPIGFSPKERRLSQNPSWTRCTHPRV